MRPIVHRIDAPLVASLMVLSVPDAVEHWVAQPDVGRTHIDLRTQGPRALGKFARFHAPKKIKVLLGRPIAATAFLDEPAVFVHLLRLQVISVRFATAAHFYR